MSGFLFQTTRSLLCESGSAAKVGEILLEQLFVKSSTILMVTDKGITSRALELSCLQSLNDCGYDILIYDDVVADPHENVVLDAVSLARDNNVKAVIGFGGGSSMDVAKLVSFLAHPKCNQHLKDVYGVNNCRGSRLPLMQVPTTAGTGSEVTPISIITTGAEEKKGVVSPILLPDFAVLDGELTVSLPADMTAATGVDAMVHAIEAYTSKFKKNQFSDLLARESLKLLGANIHEVCMHIPQNSLARTNMLLGSMYAGMAFANAPVAAVHALAYPVGSHFHVPHGLSNSIMLPHVLRFNEPVVKDMYDELRAILFPNMNGVPLADCFEKLADDLQMKKKLEQVGVTKNDISVLVNESMKQTRLLPNNPREVSPGDAEQIYSNAL